MLIRKTQTSFQFPTPTPKNNRQKSTAEPKQCVFLFARDRMV